MDTDDLEPPEKPKERPDLETMSIEALGELVAELEAEIALIQEMIAKKQDARSSADSFFKN